MKKICLLIIASLILIVVFSGCVKINTCTEKWECTEWSECDNGTQTRICRDVNECGTENNKPETSKTCFSTDCKETWSCSDWGNCSNGQQTRYCVDTSKCGTTTNKPTETQNCEEECTENWQCTTWSECVNGLQTRSCTDSSNCGTEESKPSISRSCEEECIENWSCSSWSNCSNGTQTRTCTDLENCGTTANKPNETQSCEEECIENWSCGSWGTCIGGTQTRTCTDSSECGTTKNKPATSQSCICTENWSCGAWGECANGQQTRTCTDLENCGTTTNKPAETQSCEGTLPDLTITEISWEKDIVTAYIPASITVKVKNIGTAPLGIATPQINLEITCDSPYKKYDRLDTIYDLEPGEIYEKIFNFTPYDECNYEIHATVNKLNESDFSNNELTKYMDVRECTEEWNCSEWSECINNQQTRTCIDASDCGSDFNKPIETDDCGDVDLTIAEISWSPENPKVGDSIVLTCTFKNIGTYKADRSAFCFDMVGLGLPGPVIRGICGNTPELSPNETYIVTASSFSFPFAGDYNVSAVVDKRNDIEETNEINNNLEKIMTLTE